jgi:hypothetical protein
MGALIFIIVLVVMWVIAKGIHDGKILAAQRAEFLTSHKGWDTYISLRNLGVMAISRENEEIVLGGISAWKQYSLAQVASVEVLRDGASITSTNRGSQAAGALIGGLALGGVGLLLGALSGSKRNMTTLHSVAIKIIVDDRETPVYTIVFFQSPRKKGTDARSPIIKTSLERADHFHALLVNALRNQQATSPTDVPRADHADEIRKFWDLKLAGAISDEEFATQKARLLSISEPGDRGNLQT